MSKVIYPTTVTADPYRADELIVTVEDEPGHGNAHHVYQIEAGSFPGMAKIAFQNGPIKEHGVNGVTQEALLAIVAHRLQCFQNGPYACAENALALAHVELAMGALKSRTDARVARGVEGTHQV